MLLSQKCPLALRFRAECKIILTWGGWHLFKHLLRLLEPRACFRYSLSLSSSKSVYMYSYLYSSVTLTALPLLSTSKHINAYVTQVCIGLNTSRCRNCQLRMRGNYMIEWAGKKETGPLHAKLSTAWPRQLLSPTFKHETRGARSCNLIIRNIITCDISTTSVYVQR